MTDDGTGAQLSRRVPGSNRPGPKQAVKRILSNTDVGRIQAAIHAENANADVASPPEPNTEPIPVVTGPGPGTMQAASAGGAAEAPGGSGTPLVEEPLRAAKALRAAE
ncbi:MAG TPA: hypothetical protein VMA72_08065, partial [Streptosporangiaceae bacterium]|nr:hypothetical protein [Streptosporangiaceae bacterium]